MSDTASSVWPRDAEAASNDCTDASIDAPKLIDALLKGMCCRITGELPQKPVGASCDLKGSKRWHGKWLYDEDAFTASVRSSCKNPETGTRAGTGLQQLYPVPMVTSQIRTIAESGCRHPLILQWVKKRAEAEAAPSGALMESVNKAKAAQPVPDDAEDDCVCTGCKTLEERNRELMKTAIDLTDDAAPVPVAKRRKQAVLDSDSDSDSA